VSAQRPLRRALGLRLAGTELAALLVLLAVLGTVHTVQRERLEKAWLREAQVHFERQVARVESEWLRQADLLRAQVDFVGMLDGGDERAAAARFTAFFASLGGESPFTHVLARDPAGRVVARYATRSGSADPPPAAPGAGWAYSPVDGLLYRVLASPLRVGAQGRGELLLFTPLNNALMSSIAFPEADISLHWREHEDLAVSATYASRRAGSAAQNGHTMQTHFEWAADGPQLHVRRSAPSVLPLDELLGLAGAGVAGGALLAWLAVGRWARRHVQRIDTIVEAVDDFAARRHRADELGPRLDGGRTEASLELGRLGDGLVAMMHATESAVAEAEASRDRLAELNATLEQRVAERTRELEHARDEALAAARTRQQIMAAVSHELRTPLTGLLGSLELSNPDRLPPEQRRLIEVARRSGHALRTVIDDVLDFSRLEAVGAALRSEAFVPEEVASDVVSLHAAVALHKGLRLACRCDAAARRPLLGDAARLRQVLLNLVGNALKFTDRGEVSLHVGAGAAAGALRFEVRDSGIGIDAPALAGLFNPFAQAHGHASRERGGTGLGLAISQRLVVAMGGRIEVDSTPGRGSVFRFELALPPAAPAAAPEQAAKAVEEPLRGRVLLVEDNPVNRVIASEMLRRLGLQVEEAENGLLAIEALRRTPADLVLMDHQMPVLDGPAAARRIRQGEAGAPLAEVPIVAVTANALDGDVQACLAAGMNDLLPKPFSQAELRDKLQRWLLPSSETVA